MAELSEPILTVIAVLISAGVVWKIMSERAARLVEEARSQSEVKVATTEARLEALTGEKDNMQKQMQNAFEVAAANAFTAAVKNADDEKETSFKKATNELSKSMTQYIQAITAADKADSVRVKALEKEIGVMSKLGITLADETKELTLALRGDSQVQGAWG